MKRTCSVIAFLAVICSVSVAQFGVKAGLNLTSIYGDDASSGPVAAQIRSGLIGGLLYRVALPYGFSVQPEVLYAQKGYAYSFSGGKSVKGRFDYIDIPVVVRWGPVPLSFFDSYVEVGASYGILMSASTVNELVSPATTTDDKDGMASGDFSMVFGGGVNFKMFARDMRLGFRYVGGLTKIFKATGSAPQPKITNGGGGLTLEILL
jgi:hypothetical protein